MPRALTAILYPLVPPNTPTLPGYTALQNSYVRELRDNQKELSLRTDLHQVAARCVVGRHNANQHAFIRHGKQRRLKAKEGNRVYNADRLESKTKNPGLHFGSVEREGHATLAVVCSWISSLLCGRECSNRGRTGDQEHRREKRDRDDQG